MEVLDASEALLCDAEVLALLRAQRARREDAPAHSPLRAVGENAQTVELEAVRHLEGAPAAAGGPDAVAGVLAGLRGLPLSREEKLQIVNLVPRNRAELYTLVVGCEERLSDGDTSRLFSLLATHFPAHFAAP